MLIEIGCSSYTKRDSERRSLRKKEIEIENKTVFSR